MEFIEFQWLSDEDTFKTAVQKLSGHSGQHIKRYYSSKEQDRAIRAKDITRFPVDFINHLKINPHYQGPEVIILKETDQYLVLHKPAGIHCHPQCYSDQDTLLNFLAQKKNFDPLNVNLSHYDRGLLYRLDFETSGVMVVAKNEAFFEQIRGNFQTQMKSKYYWAIVDGSFDQEGEWIHFFKATGVKGSKQLVIDHSLGDAFEGTLKVQKVMEAQGKSLVLVKLKSGLRHQIRAQLSKLGFPILGDELYGGKKAQRLFLHALHYDWGETVEDPYADLFQLFFDLDRALKMSHDMFRSI